MKKKTANSFKLNYRVMFFVTKYLSYIIVSFLGRTLSYKIEGNPPSKKVIYAFWHRNIAPLMYYHRNRDIAILISPSKDGEFIAGPAQLFGFKTVRGSSSKKNTTALREMVRVSQESSIAITPDGPKGPAKIPKGGVLYLAYLTKLPIVGVNVSLDKAWIYNTWDKLRIPKPMAEVKISYTEPINVETKDEIESKMRDLIELMNED